MEHQDGPDLVRPEHLATRLGLIACHLSSCRFVVIALSEAPPEVAVTYRPTKPLPLIIKRLLGASTDTFTVVRTLPDYGRFHAAAYLANIAMIGEDRLAGPRF